MARFTISGNTLYVLNSTTLNVFDITSANSIKPAGSLQVSGGAETLFPRGNALFMGTESGMNIYDISNPLLPKYRSTFSHVRSCDPVVADSAYAYVTLHEGGERCWRTTNELDIVDIRNLDQPYLVNSYPMTKPFGLAVSGKDLFVCDNGLTVFEITGPGEVKEKEHFNMGGYDVIANNDLLFSIGSDGLYQYRYKPGELSLLSMMKVNHRF
jgi:hypothetical protein